MNFNNFYFEKNNEIDEGIAGAIGKGIVRGAKNLVKGVIGATKTMAFQPKWMTVIKPIDYKLYATTIKFYADAQMGKTKIGKKKNFMVTDVRKGVIGYDEKGKEELKNVLEKNDIGEKMSDVDFSSDVEPDIQIYMLNNGGKVIFMQLPKGKDGLEKVYALALDRNAERAFTLIHGLSFSNYELVNSGEQKKVKKAEELVKVPVDKTTFEKLLPTTESKDFSLFNMFNEMVLLEELDLKNNPKKEDIEKELKEKQVQLKNNKGKDANEKKINNRIKELEEKLKTINDADEKNTSTNDKSTVIDDSKLSVFLKNEMEGEPEKTKETENSLPGWVYSLKNNGRIFIYQNKKDSKYYIAYNPQAKDMASKIFEKFGIKEEQEGV